MSTNHEYHIGDGTVWSKTALSLRQDPHALAVVIEAASDGLQQYFSDVRYQLDTSVVSTLCSILIFVEYHSDGILHYYGTSPLLQTQMTTSNSLYRRVESPLGLILNTLTETPSGPTTFPFANE